MPFKDIYPFEDFAPIADVAWWRTNDFSGSDYSSDAYKAAQAADQADGERYKAHKTLFCERIRTHLDGLLAEGRLAPIAGIGGRSISFASAWNAYVAGQEPGNIDEEYARKWMFQEFQRILTRHVVGIDTERYKRKREEGYVPGTHETPTEEQARAAWEALCEDVDAGASDYSWDIEVQDSVTGDRCRVFFENWIPKLMRYNEEHQLVEVQDVAPLELVTARFEVPTGKLMLKHGNGTRPSGHVGCKDGSATIARLVIALDGQGSGDPRLADSYIEIVEGMHVHIAPDGTATLLRMNRTGEGGVEIGDDNLFVKPDGVGGWEIGRWVVTTQAERKDIARHLSRHIKKIVMGSEHGRFCRVDWDKVVTCAGADAGCRISFQEDLCRSRYGKGCDILVAGFIRNALGEEAFLKDLEDRCSGVIENQIRHLATVAAIEEASERARDAFARHGISIRVRIEEKKDLSSPMPMVTHYGSLVSAYVLNHDAGKGLDGHERTLALIEDLITSMECDPGQMKNKFRHLSPESVKGESTSANTYLMNILRHLSDDPVTALRRIIAHKERKWTAEDFSDLFGRPVDLELSVRFNSGRLLCEGYLGNGVSIKNTAIVMRSLNLPETTLIALKQKATSMKMKDVIDHPCLPDSLIERMDLNPSSNGDTIVLWPVASSQENVVLEDPEERKAA